MTKDKEKRIIESAKYYVYNNSTIRTTASVFNISKSQMHIDLTIKLKLLDEDLYDAVNNVIDINRKERSKRGGLVLKHKYELLKGS